MPYGAITGSNKVIEDDATLLTTSRGQVVTAAATAHVKGAYAVVDASTAYACKGFYVQLSRSATGVDFLVDIAIGAAASEQVIVADLAVGAGTGAAARKGQYSIPIPIPAGTRVTARCQATTISSTVDIKIHFIGELPGGADPYGKCITYGANTATTQYTSVDPGGSANTKGAWTQLTASSTYAIKGFIVDTSNLVQLTRTAANWLLDIGTGAAASELVIVPNICFECVTTEDQILHAPTMIWPVSIPAGTRIAARCQSSLITATVRLVPTAIVAFS